MCQNSRRNTTKRKDSILNETIDKAIQNKAPFKKLEILKKEFQVQHI